jgi:hypothetical protein
MGFNPCADWIHATSPIPQVTLRLEQLKEARDQAQGFMIKAQQSWVKHRDTPKYKEGDQVWLEGKNLRINQPTAKLAPRRHGPFKIIQVMSAVNYRLELPTQWSIHPVFHIDLLTPYVTFFLLTTVHITDYHWDRHPYFVIHSHHAQTMTHTPPSDDSLLVHLLVVPAACDSD